MPLCHEAPRLYMWRHNSYVPVQTARLSPEVHSYIRRFLLAIFLRVSMYLVIYVLPTSGKEIEY